MLAKRIISSVVLLLIVYLTILVLPSWTFFLLVMAFAVLGLWEYFRLAERKKVFVHKSLGIVLGVLISSSFYLQSEVGIRQPELGLMAIAIIGFFFLQFARRDSSSALMSIACSLLGLLYIPWLLSFFVRLKYLPGGSLWIVFLILVAKLGDAGAYFSGMWLGRHSLIQRISPNKSIEGAVGGFLVSLVAALGCRLFLPEIPYHHLLILGVSIGILAQLGDLAESLIKRDVGVKDSGWIVPGLGGVLDIIDSLLFSGPFLYFYITVILKL